MTARTPWRVSLHGGHSGEFCDHATGTLADVVAAADRAGYHTFGVSEHAPRDGNHLLYAEERALGWTVDSLKVLFERYTAAVDALARDVDRELVVLRGFEAEVVPEACWLDLMQGYRADGPFDYVVGSVHHVDELLIDGPAEVFERALAGRGGLEGLCVRYYELVAEMIAALRPDVVGHFDLIRKNGHRYGDVDTSRVREAARRALTAAADHDVILDLNVSGPRKGLPTPYPAPWLVAEAHALGVPFCFGDDSHGPEQVGLGIDLGRDYLLGLGVDTVAVLTRERDAVIRKTVPL